MRRMMSLSSMVFLCIMLTGTLHAQSIYEVKRGERPPIDLASITSEACEPGKLLVKVQPHLHEIIGEVKLDRGESGQVITGYTALDALNLAFSVESYKPLFKSLYETNSKTSQFQERHKAWGLHLWYELTMDSKSDVIDAAQQFSALAGIEKAEPEYRKQLVADDPDFNKKLLEAGQKENTSSRWTPNDPQYNNQWHYNNTGQQGGTPGADIKLQTAWDLETGYDQVIVAIIDGGIQINHPDLAANMWPGIGYNFVTNSSTIQAHNHGTHVAGTVSGVNNNGVGISGVAGGSGSGDGVRLMSCQVFTSTSSGGFDVAPVYAADNGASISQNSWGYTSAGVYNTPVLDAIDYFNANGGGVSMSGGITIFAAGNANSSGQWYPGCYPGAFAVAATNNLDKKAWYSNYDTWVDISAPGGETNSIIARGVLSTLTGNSYGYYQGTSMACPHVSGVAALIVSFSSRNGIILANNDVKDLMKNTTDDHYGVNGSFIGKLGTGRINATNALFEVQDMMSGVMNPLFINAQTIGPNQINLNWQKNTHNNDVIIAWSYDDIFGEPIQGATYEVGEAIAGGGTILVKGSDTSFEHTGLIDATTYYYAIWSFNEFNEYSSGRFTTTTTECEFFIELPFLEDFNASDELPNCWVILDHVGNGQVWKFGRGAYMNGTIGNYAYLNSDAYGSGYSQNSDLITPTFDLSGYEDVHLIFKHRFRSFSSSAARVYYSIDNGETWVLIQTWSGSNTLNPETFNMALPEVDGQSAVRFKWKYTGTYAYYWGVDDIEVTGSVATPSASFTAEPTNAMVGEMITFSGQVGGTSYSTWEWNFGDGAEPPAASGEGPHEVVYYTNGSKTVSLTLDGVYSEIKTDYVSVNEQATVYNEDFEPIPAYNSVPPGWEVMRNTLADGGLNGNNLEYTSSDAWFVHTLSGGLTPAEIYVKNGEASLAIDYTAPDLTWAISPEIQIPDDYFVELTFWLWYASDAGVGFKPTNFHVVIFSNGSWQILDSWIGVENNLYSELVSIDITDYKNQSVKFGFVYEYTDGYPVAIDDIQVFGEAPPFWVWLGTECIDWNNPANWSKGLPNDTSDVVILGCDLNPVISTHLDIKDLTIATDACLEVAPGGQLTVNGELINNSGSNGLILNSSTSNPGIMEPDASLMHSTPGVVAKVKRYISGDPMDWHQLSTPLIAQPVSGDSPGNFNDGSFLTWYEPAQTWVNYNNTFVWPTWEVANGGNNFIEGRGYMAAYSDNPIKEFNGELNQGEIAFNLSHQAHPDDNPGFNLIGNPYPSSIDWKAEIGWSRNNLAASGDPEGFAIWIWNPEQGQYGTYHSASLDDKGTNDVSRYIAPMQGFWVKAVENGSMSMTNQVRVHSTQHWLKDSGNTPQVLRLAVSNQENNYRDQIMLEFGHDASTGGAEKFYSMQPTAPALYTAKDEKQWSISFLKSVTANPEVPVGFKPGVSAIHTLAAKGIDSFDQVLLEDLKTGKTHDLSLNPLYIFFANTGDDESRFKLHFKEEAIGVDNEIALMASNIFVHDNILYVTTHSASSVAGIYDLQGRLVSENLLSSVGQHQIALKLPAGIYVVKTVAGDVIHTEKFLVK